MPFAINDVLQHKRNDRQIRDIHEKQYSQYISNLGRNQKQQQPYYRNQYHLPTNYLNEIERAHASHALAKQYEYDRIQRENNLIYDRLRKASKRAVVDHKNNAYEENLKIFANNRALQRSNQYKRIYNENSAIYDRINNAQTFLLTQQQCNNDWKKHVNFMKRSSDYPENIDRFVTKTKKGETTESLDIQKRIPPWDDRYYINKPTTRLPVIPLTARLDEC